MAWQVGSLSSSHGCYEKAMQAGLNHARRIGGPAMILYRRQRGRDGSWSPNKPCPNLMMVNHYVFADGSIEALTERGEYVRNRGARGPFVDHPMSAEFARGQA